MTVLMPPFVAETRMYDSSSMSLRNNLLVVFSFTRSFPIVRTSATKETRKAKKEIASLAVTALKYDPVEFCRQESKG